MYACVHVDRPGGPRRHAALEGSSLVKRTSALWAPEVTHLCTRVSGRSRLKELTLRIVWGQCNDIICVSGHGVSREGRSTLAQLQLQTCKLFLQHDPWWVKLQPGKKVTGGFTGQMNRGSGHDTMVIVDYAMIR